METEVTKAVARVRAFVVEHGLARANLALRAKLSINALRDIHKPSWNPTYETLHKVLVVIERMERDQKRRTKRRSDRPSMSA